MSIPGWVGPHQLPLHTIPSSDSEATEPIEQKLLRDQDAELIFLLETTPSGGTVVRLSDVGYITASSDSPASTPYQDRLLTPYNLELAIPPPDAGTAVGSLAFGLIEIESGDEELDARLAESWEGREATIKVGGTFDVGLTSETTLTFAQFVRILRGTIQSVGWSDGKILLLLREVLQKLSEPLQANTYSGAGGLNGGDAIKQSRRPLSYGPVFNRQPTLVDAANQIWQWHDGAVDAVSAVRDTGVALTLDPAGDVADILVASPPATGKYITQNSGGYLRLGAVPAGRITMDGRGDKTGGVYVSTTATIAKRMAVRVGLVDPNDFEGGSFGGFPDTSEVAYVPEDGESALEAISKLLVGIFGWLSTTRTGELRIGKYRNPATTPPVATITDDTLEAIEDETQLPPAWRVEVEYARNWTPQDADALSDALTASQRELYSEPRRLAIFENASVKTTHKDARVVRIAGYQTTEANALALATEVQGILSPRSRVYRSRVARQMFQRQPGDVVEVVTADSDLTTGRNLLVWSVGEDAAERSNDWGLWG